MVVGRAEIHFHLLPGVDDGPATVADSVGLARAALADGTTTLVTTPHVGDVCVSELPERVRSLRAELAAAEVPLEVVLGGELAPWDAAQLSDHEIETIAVGPTGRRWALLEAPTYTATAGDIHRAAGTLRARSLGVVLAHPERSPALLAADGWEAIERELQRGSMLQVSAPSLLGVYGDAVREVAERMVTEIHEACVVASDAHSADRPPLLGEALAATAALTGDRVAAALIEDGPRDLVDAGWSASPRRRSLPAKEPVGS